MKDGFAWEVYQADRRRARTGAPLPCASIHVTTQDGESEFIEVPAAVGRRLASQKQKGTAHVSCKDELLTLVASCNRAVAWEQLVKLFDRRDYAERECVRKLVHAGFDHALAHETVQRGVACGLVSNARYADAFVRSKVAAGWGMERIRRELSNRGVQVSDLSGWPYEYLDPDDELERARNVASKKTVREPNAYAKLVRFLMGRGFSYGVATQAAKDSMSC